jgi:hypothetical protein
MRGQIAGMAAATVALFVLAFAARSLLTTTAGVAVSGAISIAVGAAVAALMEPRHALRNAATVAGFVVLLMIFYVTSGAGAAPAP